MKKLLYIGFLGFCFLVSLYLTFPLDSLRPYLEKQMTDALSGQAQGMHFVTPPRVAIGELSLWRLSGAALYNVQIQMGSDTSEPGQKLEFETLKMRLGIFSSLSGKPKIEFDSKVYSGRAQGAVTMSPEGSLSALWLDINAINLQQLRGPVGETGLKVAGQLNLDANLNLGKHPAKDGTGSLDLNFKGLSVGPGIFEIPGGGFGGMTLPLIKLGAFSGRASFDKGKAKIEDLKLSGGDIEAHINANVELADNILFSPLKGSGWFKLKPEFQKANPKIAMILDMSPDIKAAEEADGRIFFTLFGSLMAPTPKWGKGG
jgi:type II secretion system protein N